MFAWYADSPWFTKFKDKSLLTQIKSKCNQISDSRFTQEAKADSATKI